jgi:hypothetical protein
MDRFEAPRADEAPIEVGHCEICGGMMYDYEKTDCPNCDAEVHIGCLLILTCQREGCYERGCEKCMIFDNPDDKNPYCSEEHLAADLRDEKLKLEREMVQKDKDFHAEMNRIGSEIDEINKRLAEIS